MRGLPPIAGACVALSALLSLSACAHTTTSGDVDRATISLDEVRALVERSEPDVALLLDARDPSTFAAGRIPGACQLESTHFSGKHGDTDPALERYDTIVVYADNRESAGGAALAQQIMSTGYDNVQMFHDGFDAWKRAGLPVNTGPGWNPRAR